MGAEFITKSALKLAAPKKSVRTCLSLFPFASSLIREIKSLILHNNSLLIFIPTEGFLQQNVQLTAVATSIFESKSRKFPVFFPVSREFGGEELARDCAHRHAVWTVENSRHIPAIHRGKGRYFA